MLHISLMITNLYLVWHTTLEVKMLVQTVLLPSNADLQTPQCLHGSATACMRHQHQGTQHPPSMTVFFPEQSIDHFMTTVAGGTCCWVTFAS